MGEWECTVCGYVHDKAVAPDVCPDCGALKHKFVFYPFDDAEGSNDLDELADLMALDGRMATETSADVDDDRDRDDDPLKIS